MKKQAGFILFIVIIFLNVAALIGLTTVELVHYENKSLQHRMQQISHYYEK